MKISDLISNGILTVGKKAKHNPEFSVLSRFAAGVANKDYPAQTPFLWNSVYEALGMTERNIRTYGDPANAAEIFAALKADPNYIGGDIGVGFKDQVLGLLDDIDPLAAVMGAINVIVKTEKGLKGYNTDGEGYARSLDEAFEFRGGLAGQRVMLLGAGGTTNAIGFALAAHGASLVILNRTAEKALSLASRINQYFGKDLAIGAGRDVIPDMLPTVKAVVSVIDDPASPLDQYFALADIVLPATPENIAANHQQAEKILQTLPKETIISDVMLRASDTATIRMAKQASLPTLDGLPMVFNQAVEAFSLVNATRLADLGISRSQISKIMQQALSS